MIDNDKLPKPMVSGTSAEMPKTILPEELEKDNKVKENEYYKQPPSDSEDDICGPLNCDKEL